MASEHLKQRPQEDSAAAASATTTTPTTYNVRTKRAKRLAMARRGLRSLAMAIGIPLSLTLLTIFAFGRGGNGETLELPLLPVWVIHLASLSSSCLMGLSGWLMWADGGFHQQPTALSLYLAQFVLAMLWAPLVLGWGATWLGLLVCAMLFVALYGCSLRFRRVNPIAGDLVKPVLAWAAFLALMNYKLA